MPTYSYNCSVCKKDADLFRKITDRDMTDEMICLQCKSKGSLVRQMCSPLIGYHTYINGGGKPPDGFRDVLRKIHSTAPGSQLDKTSSFL